MLKIPKEYGHIGFKITEIPMVGYQISLNEHKSVITYELLMVASSDVKTVIHHTKQCIKEQKHYREFADFIENYGGYVPRYECDCPREQIPKDESEKLPALLKMVMRRLIELNREVID